MPSAEAAASTALIGSERRLDDPRRLGGTVGAGVGLPHLVRRGPDGRVLEYPSDGVQEPGGSHPLRRDGDRVAALLAHAHVPGLLGLKSHADERDAGGARRLDRALPAVDDGGVDEAAEAVRRVLTDPAIRTAAGEVQRAYADEDGAAATARIIQAAL